MTRTQHQRKNHRRFLCKDARTTVRRLAFGNQSNKTTSIQMVNPPSQAEYRERREQILNLLPFTEWSEAARLRFLALADKYHSWGERRNDDQA